MVEIFKTNVPSRTQANSILIALLQKFPSLKMNFDLDDCDNVLRIEGENILPKKIIEVINSMGFHCDILI